MMSKFFHLWMSEAGFLFNGCHHHSLLVLINGYGAANIIHIRKGVTQRDSLDMVTYGIGVLSLIKILKLMYPDATQPWYTDGDGSLSTLYNLERFLFY